MLSEKATHLSFRTLARLGAFLFFLSFALFPRVHADAPSFESYMQRDGLASDYVTHIAFARDGAVWIGTTRGATQVQDKYWITYT